MIVDIGEASAVASLPDGRVDAGRRFGDRRLGRAAMGWRERVRGQGRHGSRPDRPPVRSGPKSRRFGRGSMRGTPGRRAFRSTRRARTLPASSRFPTPERPGPARRQHDAGPAAMTQSHEAGSHEMIDRICDSVTDPTLWTSALHRMAEWFGISIHAARNQPDSAFAKTPAHSQANMIRSVLDEPGCI